MRGSSRSPPRLLPTAGRRGGGGRGTGRGPERDDSREQGFDVVLTISNQIALPGRHPVIVDKRRLGKGAKTVALHHLSWAEVLAAAVTHHRHRGVDDPEQAYILSELIRYLEHPRSGALEFNDMGQNWVSVRDDVCARTARPAAKPVLDVVDRLEQLGRYAALRLEQRLGTSVTVVRPRSLSDLGARQAQAAATLSLGRQVRPDAARTGRPEHHDGDRGPARGNADGPGDRPGSGRGPTVDAGPLAPPPIARRSRDCACAGTHVLRPYGDDCSASGPGAQHPGGLGARGRPRDQALRAVARPASGHEARRGSGRLHQQRARRHRRLLRPGPAAAPCLDARRSSCQERPHGRGERRRGRAR